MKSAFSRGARRRRLGGLVACAWAATALGAPVAHGGSTIPLGSAHGLSYFQADQPGVTTPAGPTANCGEGKFVTGGGGSISGPADAARLTATRPADALLSGWTAEGAQLAGGAKTVSAFAICAATAGNYVQDSTAFGAGASGDDASCGTAQVSGGGVSSEEANFLYYQLLPDMPTSWRADALHTSNDSETMTVYAVCSSVLDLRYRRSDRVRVPSGSEGTARVRCGRRQAVTGGGFETRSDFGPWPLASRPFDGSDGNAVPDDGWTARIYNDSQADVRLFAHAICKA